MFEVIPNTEVVRQVKLIQSNGYQGDIDSYYKLYNPEVNLYDTIEVSQNDK